MRSGAAPPRCRRPLEGPARLRSAALLSFLVCCFEDLYLAAQKKKKQSPFSLVTDRRCTRRWPRAAEDAASRLFQPPTRAPKLQR